MPAKRVVVLFYLRDMVTYALRADVPAGQEKAWAKPDYESVYGDPADPDAAAIKAGTVAEYQDANAYARLTGETANQYRLRVQASLEGRWQAFQNDVSAATPMQFHGRFWDGTTWSNLTT